MVSGQTSSGAVLIELNDIRRQYGGTDGAPPVTVLHGISLRIRVGEFVAIVGASGSGKSTLMHILGCLDKPTSGTYHFAGINVARLDPDSLAMLRREAFGFVFQGYHLIPTLDVMSNVGASRDKDVGEPSTRSYTMGLSASYEVDIWGEKRASRLSAMASRDAAVFAHDAVLLTLMASTAQSYLRTVAWRERVAIARYNLTAAERVLGLVESRYRVGSASAQETAQQRTLVASLRQVLALRQQQEHQSLTTLAVLLGRPPQKLTVRAVSLSSMKAPTVESGLPTDLLTRRPDVAAAERRLAAADADVTVARAAMLPTVRLTASYGVGADRVRDVLDNPIYNLAAGLVAPIFNNGRLAAGRDLSLARREELLADYRAAIISSLGDVENALNALQGSAKQQEAHQEVLVHGREAVRLAESRYRSGSDTMQALLDTQRTLFQAQDLAVQLRLDNLLATIDLYKALGGGWRPKRMASSK